MTKYREILRLKSLGLSQQSIADSCNVSKKTVNRVLKRAKELNISWPLDKSDTDAVLAEMFFPSAKQVRSNKRIPARVRAPKDKPNAEGTVGNISTWITAALRNEQFFSLAELNLAIRDKL